MRELEEKLKGASAESSPKLAKQTAGKSTNFPLDPSVREVGGDTATSLEVGFQESCSCRYPPISKYLSSYAACFVASQWLADGTGWMAATCVIQRSPDRS